MDRLMFFTVITIIAGFQILDAADLECNITKQKHASTTSFLYQIFHKPNCSKFHFSWEKYNSTVIVDRILKYSKSVIKSLQNDSVELYDCEDFLRYNLECENDEKQSKLTATCEVNCTSLMAKASPQVDDGFPAWGIVVTLGIILIFGIIFSILGKRFLKRVCRGSVFQNNHSSRTNRPSSQSLTQSDAGAIMDNVINEKVSTDASPFLSESQILEMPS